MAWIGLVRYMETSKEYSILGRTLSLAMPNVMKTLISTLPVLLGYTFLGVSLFWSSNRFSTATGCLTTLYALMFGDMVYDTFYDLSLTHFFSSQVYLYSFVFFSICVINSLFISVIEDAYSTAKKTTSTYDMFLGKAKEEEAEPKKEEGGEAPVHKTRREIKSTRVLE